MAGSVADYSLGSPWAHSSQEFLFSRFSRKGTVAPRRALMLGGKQRPAAARRKLTGCTCPTVFSKVALASSPPMGFSTDRFADALAVGTIVYLVPSGAHRIGRLDTTTDTFSTIALPDEGGDLEADGIEKFWGGVLAGQALYLIPRKCKTSNKCWIVKLDTTTDAVSTIACPGGSNNIKYSGGVLVGTTIYMAPAKTQNIGALDTTTDQFSTIVFREVTGNNKYHGAVAVGTTVYFLPSNKDVIGKLDTAKLLAGENKYKYWTMIAISVTGNDKYCGGALVGTKIYLPPCTTAPAIGIFDTTTDTFSTLAISGTGTSVALYAGALALGSTLYFVPQDENNIGVFETETSAFSTLSISTYGTYKYWGAAAVGSTIYFAPFYAEAIGKLATS